MRSIRVAKIAAVAVCLVLALVSAGAAVGATHFQHESFGAFQKQLSAGQIHAATFNKKAHTLHLSLNDGRHMLVSYPSHEEPQLASKLRAKGVPVAVEKKKGTAKKAAHHTLRYVAAAIVVVVIGVIVGVLLLDRRRKLGEARDGASAPASDPR
jgi:ATP-dependent Zn protease